MPLVVDRHLGDKLKTHPERVMLTSEVRAAWSESAWKMASVAESKIVC